MSIHTLHLKHFILIAFISYLSLSSIAQTAYLSLDSLPIQENKKWKHIEQDDKQFKEINYNDSTWEVGKTRISLNDSLHETFNGIAWFRLHFYIDSTLNNKALAISINHFGASEIYVDGKFIRSFGKINGKDSSQYYDPADVPFVLPELATGDHVLAIRYANYDAQKNKERYHRVTEGFNVIVGIADSMIDNHEVQSVIKTFICMLLAGIFITLCLLHLLLWWFFKKDKSNLYFSVFMFCLTMFFVITFTLSVTTTPATEFILGFLIVPLLATLFIALDFFIYELFDKKRGFVFWIFMVLYIATIGVRFKSFEIAGILALLIVIGVSMDAIVRIISAIRKKIPGSKIIGVGILFFAFFLLLLFVLSIITGEVDLSDETLGGEILLIMAMLAILSIPISMSVYLSWNFARINRNLAVQLEQVKILSQKTIEQEQEQRKMVETQNVLLEIKVNERTQELQIEKKKSDDLLLNILPEEVAEELKQSGKATAKLYNNVSVFFTDFVNFTGISEQMNPTELVQEIHKNFTAFDGIMEKHGLEKIKTIGDAYLAVCGLPNETSDHAQRVVKAALEIQSFMNTNAGKFQIRIGIHSGAVVAGIVGVKKYAYDIWGDTVNTAARMEQNSVAGKINISGATYELIKDSFTCQHRGKIQAKNKGEIDMYFVEG